MDTTHKYSVRPGHAALFVSVAAFAVYLTTMAPSVDWIDAGELATDCYTLGICHPTGYPLFTIVGFLFAHLPIASSVVLRLNIMAALFTALGAGAVVLLVHELAEHWIHWPTAGSKQARQKGDARKKGKVQPDGVDAAARSGFAFITVPIAAGLGAGLAAAFSKTWWEQSTSIEVYPLHLFLVPLVLYFFLRMLRLESGAKISKFGILFAITLALSFSNHLTTVLLAPGCLYLYFATRGFRRDSWVKIAKLAVPFCITLLLYLYLPIRSSQLPIMDWGHPATLSQFLRHVTGGQYKVWMFRGSANEQWSYFWHRLPSEFTVFGFALAIFGIIGIGLSDKSLRIRLLIFTLLLFFSCLFYAINYGIHDIDSYFLLAYLTVAIWVGSAASFAMHVIKEPQKALQIGAGLVTILLAFEVIANYADADESGNYMVEDFAHNLLLNLPRNAIVFTTQWDFWLSAAYYYQIVEGVRPDVTVIDKAMLHDRAWYHTYLARRAPQIMGRVKMEDDAFMKYLVPFDNGDPYDQFEIGITYTKFVNALLLKNLDHPIFATGEVLGDQEDPFVPELTRIPDGMAWRLMPKDSTFATDLPKIVWRGDKYLRRNYYTDNSRLFQAAPLAATAERLFHEGDRTHAAEFIDLALRFAPAVSTESSESSSGRDRDVAAMVNARFGAMEELRQRIRQSPNAAAAAQAVR